jgi:hypothetical protein
MIWIVRMYVEIVSIWKKVFVGIWKATSMLKKYIFMVHVNCLRKRKLSMSRNKDANNTTYGYMVSSVIILNESGNFPSFGGVRNFWGDEITSSVPIQRTEKVKEIREIELIVKTKRKFYFEELK